MKSRGFRVQPCVSIRLSKCRNLRNILLIIKIPMQMIYNNCLWLFCDDFPFISLHIFQGCLIDTCRCMMLSTRFQPSKSSLKSWTLQCTYARCSLLLQLRIWDIAFLITVSIIYMYYVVTFFLQTRFWEHCCTWGLVILTFSHLINTKRRNQQ